MLSHYFKVALFDYMYLRLILFVVVYFSTGISSSTQTFKHHQTGAAGLS